MLKGDVSDQLFDEDGLADACTAEKTDLAALGVRRHQVNDLDAGFQHLPGGDNVDEVRRAVVDRPAVGGGDRTGAVDRLAGNVDHAAEHALAGRNGDRRASIYGFHAAGHAVRRGHGDAAHRAFSELLQAFQHMNAAVDGDLDGVENIRDGAVFRELHVHNGAADTGYGTNISGRHKLFSLLQIAGGNLNDAGGDVRLSPAVNGGFQPGGGFRRAVAGGTHRHKRGGLRAGSVVKRCGEYFVVQAGEREPRADDGGTRQIQNAVWICGFALVRVGQNLPVGRLLNEHIAVALVNEAHPIYRARGVELFQTLAERVRLFVIRHIGEKELLIVERAFAQIGARLAAARNDVRRFALESERPIHEAKKLSVESSAKPAVAAEKDKTVFL